MVDYAKVEQWIDDNIYHTELWEGLDTDLRKKVVNNANNSLMKFLPDVYGIAPYIDSVDSDGNDVPAIELPEDVVAEQVLWLLRIDDTIQRAEMGTKSVWVDGTMISIHHKDNSIAPYVYKVNKISYNYITGRRRKVARYNVDVSHTRRMGAKV